VQPWDLQHHQVAQPADSLLSTTVLTGQPETASCSDRNHTFIIPFTASEPSLFAETDCSNSYSLPAHYVDECYDFFGSSDLSLLYTHSETFQAGLGDTLLEMNVPNGSFYSA